ncbi:MAG TPA: asparagine synthase-related protein, partial [Thermoanaerobaculia bacterium]|nr:asparagine synthase-related protein [Thermoanaerobaculia bacterium]
SSESLRGVVEAARYRGEDGLASQVRGAVAFAQLALATGAAFPSPIPPLASPDGLWLAADTRLDQRAHLADRLLAAGALIGAEAATLSDPDLLRAAYRLWGTGCVRHLAGDFAFVLWDAGRQRLLAARDRLGIKPLHWSRRGALLCFASEAGQILAHPSVPRRLDELTLADHLVGLSAEPERTFFLDVSRLPPGHLLVASPEDVRIERYWDVDPSRQTRYPREEDYAEHFLELFRNAVAERLATPGPTVAIALSGGLDSSAIGAVAATAANASTALRGAAGPRLLACSLVFDQVTDCDERRYIEVLTRSRGLDLEAVPAERFASLAPQEGLSQGCEGPDFAWEAAFDEMLRRARRQGARVLLTGQGGDDLLSGSPRTCLRRLQRGDFRVLSELVRDARERRHDVSRVLYRGFLQPLLPTGVDRALHRLAGRELPPEIPTWISPPFARRTGLRERVRRPPAPRRFRDAERQDLYAGALGQHGGSEAVSWYDCLAARRGIEVRHPFLDVGIVEYLLAIPPDQLYRVGQYKPLLKGALRGILPEEIRRRPGKARLDSFIDLVLREREARRIDQWFTAPLGAELGIFDAPGLRAAYQRYRSHPPRDWQRSVAYAITAERWLRNHLERSVPEPVESRTAA